MRKPYFIFAAVISFLVFLIVGLESHSDPTIYTLVLLGPAISGLIYISVELFKTIRTQLK